MDIDNIKVTIDPVEDIKATLNTGSIQYGQLEIGTTTTGEAGTEATVTNSGSPTHAILNFVIPQGKDYIITEEDKHEIAAMTSEEATSTFNQNVASKTTEFNTNAATKLNAYNENATTKFNEYNQNAETKFSEFNENANTYIDAIVPKNNASGVSIYIDDAIEYKAFNFKAGGNYHQEAEPSPNYPSEVEVVEGVKNLFDKNNANYLSGYILNDNGEKIVDATGGYTQNFTKVKSNTTYGINGLSTSSKKRIYFYDINKNFISRSSGYEGEFVFTTPNETKYIQIQSGHTETLSNVRLTKGNFSHLYLPLGNIGIKNVGENLLNINKITKGRLTNGVLGYESATTEFIASDSGFSFTTNAAYRGVVSDYVEVMPNQKYTYSQKEDMSALSILANYFDEGQNYISNATAKNAFTIPSNAKYVRIGWQLISAGSTTITYPQLKKGETGTESDYEPFKEMITPLDLKGEFIGKLPNGVQDYLIVDNQGNCGIQKRVRKVVLNGSESEWSDGGGNAPYKIPLADVCNSYGDIKNDYFVSNYYQSVSWNDSWASYNYMVSLGSRKILTFRNVDITSLEDFKIWLSENPVTIYYELAEPYYVPLGQVSIKTLEGINNINLLANLDPSDMEITYALDIKKYTDKKIASLSSQIL